MDLAEVRRLIAEKARSAPLFEYVAALAGDSLIYLGGTVMIGVGSYVLLPLYIRHLSTAEFGVYALIEVTILVCVAISQLGLPMGYLKWFADVDAEGRKGLFWAAALPALAAGAVCGGALALVVGGPMGRAWLHVADRPFAWTLLPAVVLETFQAIMLFDLRARRQAVQFSLASFVRLAAMAGATIWFVSIRGMGIYGILLGRIAGDAACVALLALIVVRTTGFHVALAHALPMVRYGLPVMWSGLVGQMMDAGGRYFLGYYGMFEEVGIYAVGIKLANILGLLFIRPFATAWGSIGFQIYHRPNAQTAYTKLLTYAFVLAMAAAALLMLAGPFLIALLASDAYLPALGVLPLLFLPHTLRILEYWAATPLYLKHQTRWIASASTLGIAILAGLSWRFIPAWSIGGAAAAWVIALAASVAMEAWAGRRYYPLPYDWRSFLFGVALWAFGAVMSWLTPPAGHAWVVRGLAGAALILVSTALYLRREIGVHTGHAEAAAKEEVLTT